MLKVCIKKIIHPKPLEGWILTLSKALSWRHSTSTKCVITIANHINIHGPEASENKTSGGICSKRCQCSQLASLCFMSLIILQACGFCVLFCVWYTLFLKCFLACSVILRTVSRYIERNLLWRILGVQFSGWWIVSYPFKKGGLLKWSSNTLCCW